MLQFSNRGSFRAGHGAGCDVLRGVNLGRLVPEQRVRATRVCPNTGEGYFARRPLLKQKSVVLVEQEHGKRAVQLAVWLPIHEPVRRELCVVAGDFVGSVLLCVVGGVVVIVVSDDVVVIVVSVSVGTDGTGAFQRDRSRIDDDG